MDRKCYDNIVALTSAYAKILNLLAKPESLNDVNVSLLADVQGKLIDYGNQIEQNSPFDEHKDIISCINALCENLYMLATSKGDRVNDIAINIEKDAKRLQELVSSRLSVSEDIVSLVLIIKNEAFYLREWIEYHKMLGVDHFYIYDNESTDNIKEVIANYVASGSVTYVFFPGEGKQYEAYNDAIEKYKYDTKYMAFIDTDEFLVPVDADKNIKETIEAIFDDYAAKKLKCRIRVAGIGVNWRVYGTSHHKNRPEGLVIEKYILRALDSDDMNAHIKTICNPRCVEKFEKNAHLCRYKDDYFSISENGSYIADPFFYDSHCEKIRINHYYTRSEEELIEKITRGDVSKQETIEEKQSRKDDLLKRMKEYNDVEDHIMDRYVEELRERMKN